MTNRISENRLDLVAKCALVGMSYSEIAEHTGLSKPTVAAWLRDGENPAFQAIYQDLREKDLQPWLDHRHRLRPMLDKSYRALEEALGSNNLQLKVDTAWRLIRGFTGFDAPKAPVAAGPTLNLAQLNVSDGAGESEGAQRALAGVFQQLGDFLTSLRDHRESLGRDPHERIGDEALPRTYQLSREATQEVAERDAFEAAAAAPPPQGTPQRETESRLKSNGDGGRGE